MGDASEPRAVFPGSFDPLTVAHLAIAEAVVGQCDVVRVDLTISVSPLAKDAAAQAPPSTRARRIEELAVERSWLGVQLTAHQLLADIARGYDVVVLGADKWHQLHDVAFYGSVAARDEALERLPRLALAPRAGVPRPDVAGSPLDVVLLDLDPAHAEVSSTAVRSGRHDWRA